jgi:hypothetical protein
MPTVGCSIVTVLEVTERCVSSSHGESENSNYGCTAHHIIQQTAPMYHSVTPFLCKLCSYSHYLCAHLPTVHCSTIYIINTTTHSCLTCHYAVTVLQYVHCYHLPNCTGKPLGIFQRFMTVEIYSVDDMCGKFDSYTNFFHFILLVSHLTAWQS